MVFGRSWHLSTYGRIALWYRANAASRRPESTPAAAGPISPASMYAPTNARLVPMPLSGDAQYPASPTRATRPDDHDGMCTCANESK